MVQWKTLDLPVAGETTDAGEPAVDEPTAADESSE
jgi:hypothetical protein